MKKVLFLGIVSFCFTSCKAKSEQQQETSKKEVSDLAKENTVENHKEKEDLKKELIGKDFNVAISENKEYSHFKITGFHIGSYDDNPRYLVENLRFGDSTYLFYPTKILLFEKVFEENGRVKQSLIIDVIEIDKETANIFKIYRNKPIGICSDVLFNGERSPELFALVEYEEEGDIEFYENIFKVWRANRKTGKFEEIKDLTGITVINEDF